MSLSNPELEKNPMPTPPENNHGGELYKPLPLEDPRKLRNALKRQQISALALTLPTTLIGGGDVIWGLIGASQSIGEKTPLFLLFTGAAAAITAIADRSLLKTYSIKRYRADIVSQQVGPWRTFHSK